MKNFGKEIISKFHRALFGAVLLLVLSASFVPEALAVTVTPKLELTADPGETLQEVFKITNEERQSKTFYITFENFHAVDETGNPAFGGTPEDLATWISAPDSLTMGPGETKDIPITIRIPTTADPGGHFAAIFVQTDPPKNKEVAIASKLGTLVLLRVNGDFAQAANILEFGTKNKQYLFSSLPVYFYYRFQNTGADHQKPVGDVVITNMFGRTSKILPANPETGSVLPKSIRRFETVWANNSGNLEEEVNPTLPTPAGKGFWNATKYELHNFAFGTYTAKLKVVFGTKALQSANATTTFFVFPWHVLLIFIILLLLVFIVGKFGLRRYNRYIISTVQNQSSARVRKLKK